MLYRNRHKDEYYRAAGALLSLVPHSALQMSDLHGVQQELQKVHNATLVGEGGRRDLFLESSLVPPDGFKNYTADLMSKVEPEVSRRLLELKNKIITHIPQKTDIEKPVINMTIITTYLGSVLTPAWHTDRNSAFTPGTMPQDMTINAKDQTSDSNKLIGVITVPLQNDEPTKFRDPYSANVTEGKGETGSASLFHPMEFHTSPPGSEKRTILLITFAGSDAYKLDDLQVGFSEGYQNLYEKRPSSSFIVGSTEYARLITPQEGSIVRNNIDTMQQIIQYMYYGFPSLAALASFVWFWGSQIWANRNRT